MTTTFNTLAYAKTLRDAGFTENQAEALAIAQNIAISEMTDSTVATKTDVRQLESRLTQIEKQIIQLGKDMSDRETAMLKSFNNAIFAMSGLIVAALAVAVAILK